MKKLIITTAILMFSGCIFAGAPSPIDWQQNYFRSTKTVQIERINHADELTNALNHIYELQETNKDLLEINRNLALNPEKVYYPQIVTKEVMPWWIWPIGLIALMI